MAFCNSCGSAMEDGAVFCANCGARQGTQPAQSVQMGAQTVVMVKPKIPGRGFGISSMVLAIIGLVYALSTVMSADTLEMLARLADEAAAGALIAILLYSSLSIMGVAFGCAARKRGYINGISTSGLVMGIIGLIGYAYVAVQVMGYL